MPRSWRAFAAVVALATALPVTLRADQTDSLDSRGSANPNHGGMMLAIAGGTAMLAFAPPALLLFPEASDPAFRRITGGSFFLYGTGGMAEEGESSFGSWSGGFELFQDGFNASYRHSAHALHDPLAYDDVRMGVSLAPTRRLEVGAALGYRAGSGSGARDGMTLSLPLRAGNDRGEFFLEPTYLLSETGVSWSYSGRFLLHVLGTPVWSGLSFDAQTLRTGGDLEPVATLLVGLRY
jgi:hypothetical protein